MTGATPAYDCGVSVSDLNALADFRQGASDALAPKTAADLEGHVATCPTCRQTLESLESLRGFAVTLVEEESEAAAQGPWLDELLHSLVLEARPGRSIALASPREDLTIDQTEAAMRAVIRSQASSADAAVVRTRLVSDFAGPHADVHLDVTVHVRLGAAIPRVITEVREAAAHAVASTSDLRVRGVDVTVADAFGTEQVRSA